MKDPEIILKHPYLKENIIAYLGNKRNLLGLIYKALELCEIEPKRFEFVDLFAGSGVVSRLAKILEFKKVIINDWEHYSYTLHRGLIQVSLKDLHTFFKSYGGINSVLEKLDKAPLKSKYISAYYSAKNDDYSKADYHTERLFYTKWNGEKIDSIRDGIENLYNEERGLSEKEKSLLIALLLYKAATHTNTSGVFKAYHKGFGGYGKNALGRILKPIELTLPLLVDSKSEVEVYQQDALLLAKKLKGGEYSIAYLDPPYKEHQYGSNYHLLNTISLWDKPFISNEIQDDGTLKHKAGIRRDWSHTKSDYCYKNKASLAFKELLSHIKSRYILVSYSTDGIIPFKELCLILSKKGSVKVVFNEYTTYRGGRKSNFRASQNLEFILVIDSHQKSTATEMNNLLAVLDYRELLLMIRKPIKKKKLERYGRFKEEHFFMTEPRLKIESQYQYYLKGTSIDYHLDATTIQKMKAILKDVTCQDAQEELEEIHKRLGSTALDIKQSLFFLKEWRRCLKNLAYKKTQDLFVHWVLKKIAYKSLYPLSYEKISASIDQLEDIFALRVSVSQNSQKG